jgi:hypothetical protein
MCGTGLFPIGGFLRYHPEILERPPPWLRNRWPRYCSGRRLTTTRKSSSHVSTERRLSCAALANRIWIWRGLHCMTGGLPRGRQLLKLDRYEEALKTFQAGGDALKQSAGLEYAYASYIPLVPRGD